MMMKAEIIEEHNSGVSSLGKGQDRAEIHTTLRTGRLVDSICHDLRHPLTAILAYSEFLAEGDLDTLQRKDFHKEIRLAISQMNGLISMLLEFPNGPATFRREAADIVDVVKRSIRVVAVRPEFRGIAIRYDHEGPAEGWLDPKGLQQVITNLVLNACEAVPPNSGTIHVKSIMRGDYLEITISDNGPGIPEPIRHAVFQPFVSYGKEGGTGLGLAIVQKILQDQGGKIYLDETGENGTVFSLLLPVVSIV